HIKRIHHSFLLIGGAGTQGREENGNGSGATQARICSVNSGTSARRTERARSQGEHTPGPPPTPPARVASTTTRRPIAEPRGDRLHEGRNACGNRLDESPRIACSR